MQYKKFIPKYKNVILFFSTLGGTAGISAGINECNNKKEFFEKNMTITEFCVGGFFLGTFFGICVPGIIPFFAFSIPITIIEGCLKGNKIKM